MRGLTIIVASCIIVSVGCSSMSKIKKKDCECKCEAQCGQGNELDDESKLNIVQKGEKDEKIDCSYVDVCCVNCHGAV